MASPNMVGQRRRSEWDGRAREDTCCYAALVVRGRAERSSLTRPLTRFYEFSFDPSWRREGGGHNLGVRLGRRGFPAVEVHVTE